MLKNIYDMLKPNGVLRIIVPSLEARIDRYNKLRMQIIYGKFRMCK